MGRALSVGIRLMGRLWLPLHHYRHRRLRRCRHLYDQHKLLC